jgi:hypothetical protein
MNKYNRAFAYMASSRYIGRLQNLDITPSLNVTLGEGPSERSLSAFARESAVDIGRIGLPCIFTAV